MSSIGARSRHPRAVAFVAAGGLAASALLSVGAVGAVSASAATPHEAIETVVQDTFSTADAVFTWGISNEASNRAFAPGTYNFLSAGIAPKTSGADTISEAEWSASFGNVAVQKQQPDGSYSTATWAGLKTTPTGDAIPSPTSGRFSGHRVAISHGEGTLDPAADNADIAWTGSFTVAFYSGMTQFSMTDPRLVVEGGTGTVTATLSGYGTSMDDPDVFEQLPTREVTVATFSNVDVTAEGIAATPDYAGVAVDLPESASPQVRSGESWGSFPQDFVDYQLLTGQSSYWYSSGLSTDAYKKPLAIDVAVGDAPITKAPTIVEQPRGVSTTARLGASFTVAADGTVPLIYAWERSNDEGTTWQTVDASSAALTLASVAESDDGALFRATVSNAAGSAVSDPALLRVGPYAPGSVPPAIDGLASIQAGVKAGTLRDATSAVVGMPTSIAPTQDLALRLPWRGTAASGEVWLYPGAVYLGGFSVNDRIATATLHLDALSPGDYALIFTDGEAGSVPAVVNFSVKPNEQGLHDVTYSTLRWGFNNESNNSAFAPGTFNFFSAGKVADTGGHGTVLPESSWKQTDGNVAIEKQQADGSYAPASWAGLKTSPSGASLGAPTSKVFSNHQVVLSKGVGRVDPASDNADIQWDGDFTVAYYSGMTFFYVSDPRLVVASGLGTITATLGGYGTDMNDMSKWVKLDDTVVTLATLPSVDVTPGGFVVTPAYAGVRVSVPGGAQQNTAEPGWGSFPQDYVDFQVKTGQAAYWYSSGGSVDANKAALPVTVCFDSPSCSPPASATQPESAPAALAQAAVLPPRAHRAPPKPPLAAAVPAAPVLAAAPSSEVVIVQQSAEAGDDPTPLLVLLIVLLGAAAFVLVVTVPVGGVVASGALRKI